MAETIIAAKRHEFSADELERLAAAEDLLTVEARRTGQHEIAAIAIRRRNIFLDLARQTRLGEAASF